MERGVKVSADSGPRSTADGQGNLFEQRDGARRTRANPGAEAANPGGSRPQWRAILSGASPREVLARLMAGDALGLRARIALALREHCLVLDADRVFLRAAARIARYASRYRGQPELDEWLRGQLDDALAELVEDDAELVSGSAAALEAASGLSDLARPLGFSGSELHAACSAFNRLPLEQRRAFRALVLEAREPDLCAAELGVPAVELARGARRALEVLLGALGKEVQP